MKGRVRYILYALLFILAGNLCRQDFVSQPPLGFDCTVSFFSRQMMPPNDAVGQYDHSIIAPEITGSDSISDLHYKLFTRQQLAAMRPVPVKPAVARSIYRQRVDLHPCTVDYYVFSLGKIVI